MTIRYECGQCGSILKIKDDLAGKPGKCPKCKTPFTVPNLADDSGEVSLSDDSSSNARDGDSDADSLRKPTSKADEDFDPAAFLLQDDEPPPKRSSKKKSVSPRADEDDDDEIFQIRRSETSGSKPKATSLPLDDDDDDDESPSAKTSKAKPTAVAAVAASSAAGDLLSQSAKKGRKASWNEVDPNAKPESEFDWEGLREFALKKVAPLVIGGIVAVFILFKLTSSMFGGGSNLPDLGQVTGKVTQGGQPVVGVTVNFHRVLTKQDRESTKPLGSQGAAVTDAEGKYELIYERTEKRVVKGAPVGKCRVEIEPIGSWKIPKKWLGPRSSETREVKPGRQVIDLDLTE